jgi:hypothetical protein
MYFHSNTLQTLADYAIIIKPNMEELEICYATRFWCFIVPLGAKQLPTLSVYITICSMILNLVVRVPVVEASNFFFSQSAAGLTNRVPVRDFRAGTPFHCMVRCYRLVPGLISFPHFSGVYCSLFLETVYIILKKQMTKTRPSKVCSNLSQRPASGHFWSTCVFLGSWAVGQHRS